MSDQSARLSLPYILPNQAQKHVTHNEGMQILDTVTQLSVISATLGTPPASPVDGAIYAVAGGATGDWAQNDGKIAKWENGAWHFLEAGEGWIAWDQTAGDLTVFQSGAWVALSGGSGAPTQLGINASADASNRLAVAADGVLFSHDAAGDHRLKINKQAASDTASLLFQTGWSGRAEMGTTGSDDFAIKVSADGATFVDAVIVDHTTGAVSFPNTALSNPAFGNGGLLTVDYLSAKGVDLVTNGSGLLGNAYNMPANYVFDPITTPNLPGAFSFAGYYPGPALTDEFLSVDPNKGYRLSCYIRQESTAGDWSAYTNEERHQQFAGVISYDADQLTIQAQHHMRFVSGGTDSLTELAAPLTPGDTSIQLVDAAGWNDADASANRRGVIVFGYKNASGGTYHDYSRLVEIDLFELSGVNKSTNVITLNKPLPASLGNPDDTNGTWPAGTRLANSMSGGTYKYALMSAQTLAQTDTWYRAEGFIGGVDRSGKNAAKNFPPGTAFVKLMWLPNFSNRSGGYSTYPDTGTAHRVWFAGISMMPEPTLAMKGLADGSVGLKALSPDYDAGTVSLVSADRSIQEI